MSTIVPVDNTDLLMLATSNDLLRDFVADKRSPKTKHEYTKDLTDFFRTIIGAEPTPQRLTDFLRCRQVMDTVGEVLRLSYLGVRIFNQQGK